MAACAVYQDDLLGLNLRPGSKDYIRLLRPMKTLQGSLGWGLEIHSLQKAPKYVALSYSWGTRPRDSSITLVDGKHWSSLAITQDLSNALHRLEPMNSLRWFWVDAICINQESAAEKSNQVAMMRSVYSSANRVFVWLGEFMKGGYDFWMQSGNRDGRRVRTTNVRKYRKAGLTDAKFVDLISQGKRAWWSRLWIMQEILSVEVVVCIGSHAIRWDSFLDCFLCDQHRNTEFAVPHTTNRHCWYCMKEHQAAFVSSMAVSMEDVKLMMSQLISLNQSRSCFVSRREEGEDIFELLMRTRPDGVSDPKDRIYSLLGIALPKDRNNILVEYESDVVAIFKSVVRYYFSEYASINILVMGWPCGDSVDVRRREQDPASPVRGKSSLGLPTWLPDFCKPHQPENSIFNVSSGDASGHLLAVVELQDHALRVDAVPCDTIASIWTSCNSFEDQGLKQLKNIARVDGDPLGLQGNEIRDLARATEYSKISSAATSPGMDPTYFITCQGLVGFAGFLTAAMETGDEIAIAFGCSIPILLRPHLTADGDDGVPFHTLVGGCYVQDIMDGELMDLHKRGIIESKTYHLV